jgi:uncharacterized protein (DUF2141 family)
MMGAGEWLMSLRWFLAATFIGATALADSGPGTITVDVSNVLASEGWEMCALFSSSDGFPLDVTRAVQRARAQIHDGRATCEFKDVKPGSYAIAAMRDENGNGVPAKDFFDLPKSGVGASNDAKGFMGPPKFDDARFDYHGGPLRIAIKMTYRGSR